MINVSCARGDMINVSCGSGDMINVHKCMEVAPGSVSYFTFLVL